MNRTWLWLEDQPSTMEDFTEAIKKAGLSVRSFRTPGELINQLVDWRQQKNDQLDRVGFLLDILLAGQRFITCPTQWCGGKDPIHRRTQNGYDAGLVFYELCVLGEGDQAKTRIWTKPPPVLFLTVLHTDTAVLEPRLEKIRERWGKAHDVPVEDAQVDWIYKWDPRAYEKLVQRLRDWGEVLE